MIQTVRRPDLLALALLASLLPCVPGHAGDLPAPSATAGGKIAVERFALQRRISKPQLSPDGTWVAARAQVGENEYLIAYPFDDPTGGLKRIALGKIKVEAVNWAGSRRLLLTVRSTMSVYGNTLATTRLMGVDLITSEAKMLDTKSHGLLAGDVLYTDPAGGWALVSGQDDVFSNPSVKRIDLPSGKTTIVERERPDVWNWYADDAGNVRAGVAYQGDSWKVWYRETPGGPLQQVKGRRDRENEGAVDGIRFTKNPGEGLIVTNAKTDRFAAYAYDLKTGTIGAPIYENPEVDVQGVMVDAQGAVIGINYEDDRARVFWIDKGLRSAQATLDKALPGAANLVLGTSSDQNRMLLWSGSASNPGSYYLYDRKAKRIDAFAEPFDQTDPTIFAPVKPIQYASRDGLTIHGYLTLPKGAGRGLPMVVMPHGGPFLRDSWDFDPYVQFLASRGYAVLQPNFRGSTGYGKAFVERGYGQWGTGMQDDIDDGVDWAVKQGYVDPGRVCIMGASYGGYAALWGAIRNPERYRCAVSLAGVTDLPGMLKYDRYSFSAPRYYRAWQRKVAGEEKRDLSAVSPLAQAARLKIPVFIAHGEDDTRVPAKQGHAMVKALTDAGAPVISTFYPNEGHGLTKREDTVDFLKRLEAFLAKHNPA